MSEAGCWLLDSNELLFKNDHWTQLSHGSLIYVVSLKLRTSFMSTGSFILYDSEIGIISILQLRKLRLREI